MLNGLPRKSRISKETPTSFDHHRAFGKDLSGRSRQGWRSAYYVKSVFLNLVCLYSWSTILLFSDTPTCWNSSNCQWKSKLAAPLTLSHGMAPLCAVEPSLRITGISWWKINLAAFFQPFNLPNRNMFGPTQSYPFCTSPNPSPKKSIFCWFFISS